MTDTPAGWFNDPSGSGQLRYWDGAAWTEHYAPGPAATPGPATAAYPPYQAAPYQPTAAYPPTAYGPPPRSGMSGCLKVFLVVLAVCAVGGFALLIALLAIGGSVAKHLNTAIVGTAGRPASMPSGAKDYADERKQDHVALSGGTVVLGSISATTSAWAKVDVPASSNTPAASLLCGQVSVNRATVTSNNPFDAALQLAGDFTWQLVPPSGSSSSYDAPASGLTGLNDYLTGTPAGPFSGKVCFPYPSETGQFAVTWQPRLFRAERAVWLITVK